jgi:hypothetical protein
MYFTPVNHRMPVCEQIDMPVKDNAPPYKIGIIQIILSLYIIANVITDVLFLSESPDRYMWASTFIQNYNSTKNLP